MFKIGPFLYKLRIVTFNEPIYYSMKNPPKNKYLKSILNTFSYLFGKSEMVVTERILEIPFMFQNIKIKK